MSESARDELTIKRDQLATELAAEFEGYSINKLNEYKRHISSKMGTENSDGDIFPPYIPRIGENYFSQEKKILLYATAQVIPHKDSPSKFKSRYEDIIRTKGKHPLIRRLYFKQDDFGAYNTEYHHTAIEPYSSGIMPALAGLYLLAQRDSSYPSDLNDIHSRVAVSNYYKFSLRFNDNDWNPEIKHEYMSLFLAEYYRVNDDLVKMEVAALDPDVIIKCFLGRRNQKIIEKLPKRPDRKILVTNDPAWIRRRNSCLKENGSWRPESDDRVAKDLIAGYVNSIEKAELSSYKNLTVYLTSYLSKYYSDWKNHARINIQQMP